MDNHISISNPTEKNVGRNRIIKNLDQTLPAIHSDKDRTLSHSISVAHCDRDITLSNGHSDTHPDRDRTPSTSRSSRSDYSSKTSESNRSIYSSNSDLNSQSIDINATKSMMRARSHKYPDTLDDDNYIDTTYYDEKEGSFDLGYQRLKYLDPKLYPQFSFLKKLFIDHNNLTILPDPEFLPNLEQLTCSYNRLTDIPLYPKLTFLNISNNNILDCSQYHNSHIQYFDCSFNSDFIINFSLPECKHLYINDTGLKTINLDLMPNLRYLDCGNNNLSKINGGNNLFELNIQSNHLTEIPVFPNLKHLTADYNEIRILPTYPKLKVLNITNNPLVEIKDQPLLEQLTAHNNQLQILGKMPELEVIDLQRNHLTQFTVPPKTKYLYLQFNPTTELVLDQNVLKNIKELQVNFETYKYIYKHYYHSFDRIHIQINEGKLRELLLKLNKVFTEEMSKYIYREFTNIKFDSRDEKLFKITLKLYWDYFSHNKVNTVEELVKTKEFECLSNNIRKFYYKTLVVTLYFNGCDQIYDERWKDRSKVPLEKYES